MNTETGMQVRRMVKAILLSSINMAGCNLDDYDSSMSPQVDGDEHGFVIRVPWPFVVRLGALYEALNVLSTEVFVDPVPGGGQGVRLDFTFCTVPFTAYIGLGHDEI